MIRMIFATVAAIALGGCAVPLTAENTVTKTFSSAAGPEATYRTIVRAARDCYMIKGFTVDGDFFQDTKTGSVLIALMHTGGISPVGRYDIAPSGENAATVTAVFRSVADSSFVPYASKWLAGDSSACPR